jgi:hypothetical protein
MAVDITIRWTLSGQEGEFEILSTTARDVGAQEPLPQPDEAARVDRVLPDGSSVLVPGLSARIPA